MSETAALRGSANCELLPGNMRLILASASPRRTELLLTAGLSHEVIPSGADEDVSEPDPRRLVEKLSERKAMEVFERFAGPNGSDMGRRALAGDEDISGEQKDFLIVIGADTVVALDGVILGKPVSREDAARMLHMISGRPHHVFTGVTLCGMIAGRVRTSTFSEESTVHVDSLSESEIEQYIATGEPMDKAGAYGIQGSFMKYVTHIEGDYFNIVGLPVSRLYRELKTFCGCRKI